MNIFYKSAVILFILLLTFPLVAQVNKGESVEQLLLSIPEYEKKEDTVSLVETLIKIIDLKPDYLVARKMLGGMISTNTSKIKKDLAPKSGLFEKAIKYSLDYISQSIGAIYLLRHYYEIHNEQEVRELLEKMLLNKAYNKISSSDLLSFDSRIDKKLYDEIMQVLISLIDNDSRVNLCIYYYLTSQKENLLNTIEQTDFSDSAELISISDINKLDPTLDSEMYKLLYPKLMVGYSKEKLLDINNPDTLYQLGQNFYFCGDGLMASSIFSRIYSLMEANPSEDYNYLFYWGISCLFKDQQYRAKLIFDQIYKFGDDSVRANLKSGLKWWNQNLFYTSYTEELITTYFGNNYTTTDTYQPENPAKENKTEFKTDPIKVSGNYFALVIGVADYLDSRISSLFHPAEDAKNFASLLENEFTFDEKNIILLKNPTRRDILKELYKFRKELTESDNLLIFYAGHGVWDPDIQQGYWLPSDAQHNDISNWISNSDIRDYIRGIKSKHTLLISDACFSGGIFKTREPSNNKDISFSESYKYVSRRAITSGAVKTVPDKSVFVEYLMKRLQEDSQKYITSQQLYMRMKDAVINNSPSNQTPLYGIIQETGDEGPGDFIFIKK